MGLLNKNRAGKLPMGTKATETWKVLRSYYESKTWQIRRNIQTPKHTHFAKTQFLRNRKCELTSNS